MEHRELAGMERVIEWLPRTGQPFAVRFAASTAIMALAFVISLAFAVFLDLPALSVLLFGVFSCAVIFNHGTGYYAGALAILAATFTNHLLEYPGPTLAGAIVFSLVCGAVALFGEALRKALERAVDAERMTNILFRELQHRTHNTLAVIVSLLELQSRGSDGAEAKEALKAAANRVRIQSEAYRHLDIRQADKVDGGEYLSGVCRLLEQSIEGARPIAIKCEAQPVSVDAQKILALGLITNELVTNAVKYAFGETGAGTITVKLDRNEDGFVRLRVLDDGRGCPEDAAPGTGSRLIAALVREHKGTYGRVNHDKGCEVVVTLAPKPPRT
jgi:two-component sensor histidine kinase